MVVMDFFSCIEYQTRLLEMQRLCIIFCHNISITQIIDQMEQYFAISEAFLLETSPIKCSKVRSQSSSNFEPEKNDELSNPNSNLHTYTTE